MSIKDTFSKALERVKAMTTRKQVTAEEKYKADTYRQLVVEYVNKHLDKGDGVEITIEDTYVVWSCKTLRNFKCLISTNLLDGMYYELTYNGERDEVYLDAYKKFENQVIKF